MVDLTDKSPVAKKKKKNPIFKGILAGGSIRSTDEETNEYPDTEGKVVFTLMFKDSTGRQILDTHQGLWFMIVSNCLVSNMFLPANLHNVDGCHVAD